MIKIKSNRVHHHKVKTNKQCKKNKKCKKHKTNKKHTKKIYGGNTPTNTPPLLTIDDLSVLVPNSPTSVAEINTPPKVNEEITILPVEEWEEIGPEITSQESDSEQSPKRRRLTYGGKGKKMTYKRRQSKTKKQKGGKGFTVTEGSNENNDRTSIH